MKDFFVVFVVPYQSRILAFVWKSKDLIVAVHSMTYANIDIDFEPCWHLGFPHYLLPPPSLLANTSLPPSGMQLFIGSADFLFFHFTNLPLTIEKHCTKFGKDLNFLFFVNVQVACLNTKE